MHDVFISYSSKNAVLAENICRHLENNEIICWMAPRNIAAGSDYTSDIPSAIARCTCFLLVMTRDAQASPWVHNELIAAVSNGKKIIPILMEKFQLAENFEFLLRGAHWEDGSGNLASALNRIVSSVKHSSPHLETEHKSNLQKHKENESSQPSDSKKFERMLRHAQKTTINNAEMYEMVIRSAEGDAQAQYMVGRMYYENAKFGLHNRKAVYWLSLAASKEHPMAMYLLGKCYYYGLGVKRSYAEAVLWYRKSIQVGGVTNAMWSLGDCYRDGVGVERNIVYAADYYQCAMNENDPSGARRYVGLLIAGKKMLPSEGITEKQKTILSRLKSLFRTIVLCVVNNLNIHDHEELKIHGYSADKISEEQMEQYRQNGMKTPALKGWGYISIAVIVFLAICIYRWIDNALGLSMLNQLGIDITLSALMAYSIIRGMMRILMDEDVDERRRTGLFFVFYIPLSTIFTSTSISINATLLALCILLMLSRRRQFV